MQARLSTALRVADDARVLWIRESMVPAVPASGAARRMLERLGFERERASAVWPHQRARPVADDARTPWVRETNSTTAATTCAAEFSRGNDARATWFERDCHAAINRFAVRGELLSVAVIDRQAAFTFASPPAARLFVKRLVFTLPHLALLIDQKCVIVIDGGDEPRTEQIRQLARSSGSIPAIVQDASTLC